MALDYDLKLEGLDVASAVFEQLQPFLKQATAPVLQDMAKRVAEDAKSAANVYHPRNIFRATGKGGRTLNPNYKTKKQGEFWWVVQTPGGEVGKVEAMVEFAAIGHTPQGGAFVRSLTSTYGRDGSGGQGRILYKTFDELAGDLEEMFYQGVNAAIEKAERKLTYG